MEKTPEEYQAELMRLYHTVQASAPETASSPTPAPAAVPQPSAAEPEMQQPETEPEEMPQPPDTVPETEETAPPAETVPPPQLEIDETSPEQPAIGWLQIITRSAGNARALARMHKHEDDKADCRNRPENQDDIHKRRRVHHIEYRVHEMPFLLTS